MREQLVWILALSLAAPAVAAAQEQKSVDPVVITATKVARRISFRVIDEILTNDCGDVAERVGRQLPLMPPAVASAATAALLAPKLRNKTRASTLNTAANATHRLRFSSSLLVSYAPRAMMMARHPP